MKPSEVLDRIFQTVKELDDDYGNVEDIKELLLDCSYLLNTMIDRMGNGRF